MPSLVPLDNILGALLIGVVLSTIVYGITCLQVFLYYTEHCKRDGWFLKGYVLVIWLVDTLHLVLITVSLYQYTVTNWGDLNSLQATWSILIQAVIGTFLSLLVQCFFAYRVYRLGRKKVIIPLIICCLSVTQFVLGALYAKTGLEIKLFANAASDLPFTTSALAVDLACDCTIAASMAYYLYTSRTMIPSTNRVISLLIKYVINTCLLEALCVIPCLILWVTQTETLVYAPFFFVLVRLYSCSMLCSLNNRDYLRDLNTGRNDAITMSTFQVRTSAREGRTQTSSEEVSRDDYGKAPTHVRLVGQDQSQGTVSSGHKLGDNLA